MEELIIRLRQYVADHPPNYGDGDCYSSRWVVQGVLNTEGSTFPVNNTIKKDTHLGILSFYAYR